MNKDRRSDLSFSLAPQATWHLGQRPLIVAELSANHDQDLDKALQLVGKCAEAGVDAVKLQTFQPSAMVMPSPSRRGQSDPRDPWGHMNQYSLYCKAQTPREWHEGIFREGMRCGVPVFSSVFDPGDVEFLETLDCPAYKISSFELTHVDLLKAIGKTRKPIILSTGMATLAEILEALEILASFNRDEIALLKCTSAYPAPFNSLNLKTISHMQSSLNVPIGFSDHSLGQSAALVSVALGVAIIEKHVMLDDASDGLDGFFSLPVSKLARFVDGVKEAWMSLGSIQYGPVLEEEVNLAFRRSLHFKTERRRGQRLRRQDFAAFRLPGGLPPKLGEYVAGRRLAIDVGPGDPVTIDCLES